MKLPTIGVVIATPGRASIYRTLRSIQYQGLLSGDDVLVVGDGFHQATKDLVEAFGPPFRYVATRATRDWGHSQLNWGLKRVGGDVVIYQDDDDEFAPRAFEEIRRLMAEHPDRPMIGRVKTPNLGLLWSEPGMKTMLDGHCLVAPNDKTKLGYVAAAYHGDQGYISTTLEHYEGINWVDRVWTVTRTGWKLFPKREQPSPTTNVYAYNFYSEFVERMPACERRVLNGEDDWTWFFYSQERGPQHPIAALRMFEEESRTWATMSFVPGDEVKEVVEEVIEFASWAAQGRELWFATLADDDEIIDMLHIKGYQDHMVGKKNHDYTMAWPPNWFPHGTIYGLTGPNGERIQDWRDRW